MTTTVAKRGSCPVCSSTKTREHAPSRLTGSTIVQCRTCGARALAERPTMDRLTTLLDADRDTYATWVGKTRTETLDRDHRQILERIATMIGDVSNPSLFDVGAGAGGFLELARERGFTPAGNELSTGAIELARERLGLELQLGDLSELEDPGQHDALTMWCVLAHVPDGQQLLMDARRALKPQGILYLQTPRWCGMDTLGMAAHDVTRGRFTKVTDRRLALHHMVLHTASSMRKLLETCGYEVIAIEPRSRYSLTTSKYLESLGVGPKGQRRMSRSIDQFVDRDLFFRNVLDVFARKSGV